MFKREQMKMFLAGVIATKEVDTPVYMRVFDDAFCVWYMKTSEGWLAVTDKRANELEDNWVQEFEFENQKEGCNEDE